MTAFKAFVIISVVYLFTVAPSFAKNVPKPPDPTKQVIGDLACAPDDKVREIAETALTRLEAY